MSKFRVGDRVRATRDQIDMVKGKEYEVIAVDPADTDVPIRVRDDAGDGWWLAMGDFEPATSPPLTIREGRFYRTRSGLRVGPAMSGGDPDYPWWVGGTTYTDNGSWLTGDIADNQDLVAEWSDDAPDPDALLDWSTGEPAAAQDGGTAGFTVPLLDDDEFDLTAIGRAYVDGYVAGVTAGGGGANMRSAS